MAESRETVEPEQGHADRRRWRQTGRLGGLTLGLIGGLVIVILALDKADLRVDWSADSRFSLQPALTQLLAELDEPVELVAVWPTRNEHPAAAELADYLSVQLRHITDQSPLLRLRRFDPVLDEAELAAWQEQHVPAGNWNLYVVRGDKRPFQIPVTLALRRTLQRQLGGALISLAQDKLTPVYVLQGHGELGLEDGRQTMHALAERLRLSGFRIQALDRSTLSSAAWGRFPTDGVLLIPGPTQDLGTDTIAKLHDFLEAGGRLCLLTDDRCPEDLHRLLQRWCIVVDRRVLHGQQRILYGRDQNQTRLLLDAGYGIRRTPVTSQVLAREATVISPRSVFVGRFNTEDLGKEDLAVLEQRGAAVIPLTPNPLDDHLAVLLGDFWQAPYGSRDAVDVPEAVRGLPAAIARSMRYPPLTAATGPSLLIWGSREAANDDWRSEGEWGNLLLLTDMIATLADRGASLPIDDQDFAAYEVHAEPGTIWWLMVVLVALLPSTCVGIAVLTWWERRRG